MATSGVVTFIIGSVLVGQPGGLSPAHIDEAVRAGEMVRTGAASVAILTLKDSSRLKLGANAEVVLGGDEHTGEEVVQLNAGGVFSQIAKNPARHFLVRTRGATMGVRGTRFFTAYGEPESSGRDVWMCVQDGQVEVETPKGKSPVLVHEGEGVLVPAGKDVTPPRAYEWTKDLNWNMDPEKGDVEDHGAMKSIYKNPARQNYD